MMTKFSRWMLYISSYSLLYVLLIFKIFGFRPMENMTLFKSWEFRYHENRMLIFALFFLLLISVTWIASLGKWKNNTRYKRKIEKNISFEMIGFILPYLVSMGTITIDDYGIISNVIIFLVIGIAFVYSEKIYLSPVFLFLGFKLYSNGSDHILSKSSMESINLAIEENSNGVEVRELARNTYIIY